MAGLRRLVIVWLMVSWCVGVCAQEKPKVRAITAFIRLDRAHYQQQIQDTLAFLRQAKAAIEKSGYEVQGVRITTQPFPEYIRGLSHDQVLAFFHDYDALAVKEGFDASIGPAMLADNDDPRHAELLGEILAGSKILEGSVAIAGDDGIHWNVVRAAAKTMKYLEEHTPHSQGNFNFAAAALVPALTPFYPASWHSTPGKYFALGLQSANVVAEAFAAARGPQDAAQQLHSRLGLHAQALEKTAQAIAQSSGWQYAGIDLSPAPLKDVSIGGAIENLTHARFGSSATMTAVATITGVLKDIPVKHAGYSGLMLPILEDSVLAQRWSEGRIAIDALLAYSAVCGTGLDTIPLPGDISEDQLARMMGDVASLSVKWHKPLSARLLPVAGKKAGERSEFDDPFLVNTVLQPVP